MLIFRSLTHVAAVFLVGTLISAHSAPLSSKGIRAIVFSGALMREPLRIGDVDEATRLYISFMRGRFLPIDSLTVVEGRRCITISAFMLNARNENILLEQLPPGGGDFNYRLYLFTAGVQPMMTAGKQLWRLTPAASENLAALGISIADSTRSVRCN